MDITLSILFLFLILIVLVLVSPAFLSRIKRAEEKKLTPLFEEWCAVHRDSGSRGSVGRNMFLWRVSLYPEFMVLGLFSQDLIPYRDIDKVEVKNFQNSKEVWLNHHIDQGGEFITIKSEKAERIAEVFAGLGIQSNRVPAQSKKIF
jgi:hypothetical protein